MSPASPTPDARREAIVDFYRTVGAEGRPDWSGPSLAIHFGLDAEGPATLQRSLVETNRELARRTGVGRGTRVRDAGCGVGGSALWLAQTLGAAINPEGQILAGHIAFFVILLVRPRGLFPRAFD